MSSIDNSRLLHISSDIDSGFFRKERRQSIQRFESAIASLEKEDKKLTIKTFESNEMNNQISISKDTNADTLSYVVNIENTSSYGEKANIQLTMQFKNLSKLESVEENIEAVVKYSEDEDETAIKLNYNNVNTFLKDAEIESFNSDNAIVLNDKSEDEINDLVETIIENLGLN